MPPKAKFTRQEIIDAVVDIARRAPLEAVTAQELASVLGTSTRPVFTYFRTLEEVRAAVVAEAGKIYGRYVERGLSMNPPFKGYGMETIRFAREEPNLFRLLFLCRRDTAEFPPTENHSADIRRAIRETFSLTDAQADELHRHLWIYVHGLCTLIVAGVNDIPDTAAVCLVCSMNDMAVPSVSLEGKTLWISRSLPVDAWTVLRAKCGVQFLLTAPGAVFAAVCSAIALRAGFAAGLLMALCCAAFVLFSTYFALYIGLHNVNLVWTNEINVIKQGSQIFLALLAGWAAPVILVLPYMLVLRGKISGEAYIALLTLVLALAAAFFRRWLRTKGVERFENL